MENQVVATSPSKHRLLNICVLGFVVVLTAVTLVTFFVATFGDYVSNGYSIASIYILCMLLAAPTLKVFLDKISCLTMKRLNIVGIVLIFMTILVITVTICIKMVV